MNKVLEDEISLSSVCFSIVIEEISNDNFKLTYVNLEMDCLRQVNKNKFTRKE
jgi:hypothetical protein